MPPGIPGFHTVRRPTGTTVVSAATTVVGKAKMPARMGAVAITARTLGREVI
jgi:hypothetical protein